MRKTTSSELLNRAGVEALAHMEQALKLIDRCELWDVSAHQDLAICRLREVMEQCGIHPPSHAAQD